jgi:hypothetical protein
MLVVVSCVVWLGLRCAGNQRAVMDPTKQVTALNTTDATGASGSPFVLADVTKLVPQRFCVFPLLGNTKVTLKLLFLGNLPFQSLRFIDVKPTIAPRAR